ncbi:MAG: restriction endonuclease subunit S, partial [Planctomycetota bacterium]
GYDDGINQTHLPNAAFKKCPILLPPADEQARIVQRVDFVTDRIDTLSQSVAEASTTLREFRTALISAAVTGKIDVREHVP